MQSRSATAILSRPITTRNAEQLYKRCNRRSWSSLRLVREELEMKTYQKSADAIAKLDPEQYRVTQEWR
jgi:hypothetical protein